MENNENQQDVLKIEAFNFWDFCLKVQDGIKSGYEFSENNQYFPQAYIGNYFCTLVLQNKEPQVKQPKEQVKSPEVPKDDGDTPKAPVETPENPEQKEKSKPGRKAAK